MRGILKSVTGSPVSERLGRIRGMRETVDDRVEVTLVLDDVPADVLDRMIADCGRGYYQLVPDDGTLVVVRP